ncbi:hypothetical protein [Cognatishimia maritima]|uniref:hypothetical protein n=1 Tax=Cognatishimia maritima TaxID=870908 RepID=UPI0009348720|nr:hypothetical protein [Cognatishimia maritima]
MGHAESLAAVGAARVRKGQRHVGYNALLFAKHRIILDEGMRVESLYPEPQAMALLCLALGAGREGRRDRLSQADAWGRSG